MNRIEEKLVTWYQRFAARLLQGNKQKILSLGYSAKPLVIFLTYFCEDIRIVSEGREVTDFQCFGRGLLVHDKETWQRDQPNFASCASHLFHDRFKVGHEGRRKSVYCRHLWCVTLDMF